jgi:hypothetical protein
MLGHHVKLEELAEVNQRYDSRENGPQKIYVQTRFSFRGAE